MYQDRDSIELFKRHHEQDRVREYARHAGDSSSDDTDLFAAHARAEVRDGQTSSVLSFVLIAALIGALVLFWK